MIQFKNKHGAASMGFEFLERLIVDIKNTHAAVSERWAKSPDYKKINLSSRLVIDVMDAERNHPEYMEYILKYRSFLYEELTSYCLELGEKNCESRVKNQNSIECKLAKYMGDRGNGAKLNGEIPLKKCLNDLFGIRYIFEKNVYTLTEILEHIKTVFPELKVMDSSKNGYRGVHVYFQGDNYTFPWELQIWNIEDAANNKISHSKYKQEYTKWEKQSEEEVE